MNRSKTAKLAAGVLGLAMVFVFSVPSANAQTIDDLTAQINSLLATIASLQAQVAALQGGGGSTASVCPYTWAQNLTTGSTGGDVLALQKFLNSDPATVLGSSGAGSPGNETSYFGSITRAGVVKFQNKYASEVLTPLGLSGGTGYFGSSSRAKANALCVSAPTPPPGDGDGPTPVDGTSLSVSKPAQPANSLAPQGAARVPFTNFTVTAGNDGAVSLTSITVERTSLVNKAAFAGIVLLDENGTQLGTSKTLNSNNQATIGESTTIPAGQSRTFTVAANMAADLSARAGEVGGLNVIAVNSDVTVLGALPISGALHTMNATLSIGTATLNVSSFDPNTSQSKEIGSTNVRFAGIRVTAGSGEDIRVQSIRWNQTGSASKTDLNNLVVIVEGVSYPVTVSADGKFYSSSFGSGIVVPKGNNIDVYIQGDIVGGTNRTVIFDIDKTTDFYATGELYGFGITPTAGATGAEAANTSTFSTDGSPFFDASTLTILAGSATTIQKASSVSAQNIAVNVPNQPLGGFETNFKGERVTVSAMTLTVASTTGSGTGLLTNVSIVDQNGSVVAGPIDATYTSALVQSLPFTDSVTFPTGKMVYTIQGKVAANIGNGGTYIVTVTPSGWTSPVGDSTGDAVSLSAFGAFTLNTMTVKAAQLDVTLSSSPVAQNIVAGTQGFTFANVELDATQSGENVRFSSMVFDFEHGQVATEGDPSRLSACQVWNGSTALNTGSNIVNPTSVATTTTDASETFTFDNALVVPKGTVVTVALKCNVSSSSDVNSTFQLGIRNVAGNMIVTGVTSSNAVTETVTASNGQRMTITTGSIVASEDSSSPSYAIVSSGSTGVDMGTINLRASNEAATLQRIGFNLTNSASSSGTDLVRVSIWDGATEVGSAVFTGAKTRATSTAMTVNLPKDVDKDLKIKVDLAQIGTSQIGTQGALIAVDIDTNGTNTQGVGESGTTINASGSTTFSGVRVFKSFPTVAKIAVPSTTQIPGVMDLYRFSITASAGGNGIGLYQLTLNLSTSTGNAVSGTTTVTLVDLYAYTNSSFSVPVSGFTNGKIITQLAGLLASGDNDAQLSSVLQIPAGATYYFKVRGTVTETAGTGTFSGSITSRIGGDSTYPSLTNGTLVASTTVVDGNGGGDNFVWSPNATTSSLTTHNDWTNGFNVSGLPSDGTDSVTISR